MLKYGVHINHGAGEQTQPGDEVNEEFGCWFVGFVDGEGHFAVDVKKCGFHIKLRADDRSILERIRDEFRIGKISKQYGGFGNQQDQVRFSVHRQRELVWLTEFFDQYRLQSKKQRDYGVWREAVIAWYSGCYDLTEYRDEIRQVRAYVELEDALTAGVRRVPEQQP